MNRKFNIPDNKQHWNIPRHSR